MVSAILLEGLKRALANGESLNQAMRSFYHAGYKKEVIEEAARALQENPMGKQISYTPPKNIEEKPHDEKIPEKKILEGNIPAEKQPKKNYQQISKPIQKISNYGEDKEASLKKIRKGIDKAIEDLNRIEFPEGQKIQNQTPVKKLPPPKKVSDYENPPKKKKTLIIVLAIILVFLLLVLGAVFLFKEQVLNFFDNSEFFSGLFG